MMINPEFHRNVWLNFSPFRVAAPLILVALALAIFQGFDGWMEKIFYMSYMLYLVVVLVWGNYAAAASLNEEIKHNTWDFQKMSSIGPWQLALGKLFGSTSYVWYFGGVLIATMSLMYVLADMGNDQSRYELLKMMSRLVLAGVMGHAFALLISLHHLRLKKNMAVLPFIAGLIMSINIMDMTGGVFAKIATMVPKASYSHWHGMAFDTEILVLLSIVFFFVWSVIGIQRTMREELQFFNTPIVWTIFLASLIIFLTGHIGPNAHFEAWDTLGNRGTQILLGFLLTLALTYGLVVIESGAYAQYRRLSAAFKEKHSKRILENLPLWAATAAFLFFFYVLMNVWFKMNMPEKEQGEALIFTTTCLLFLMRDGLVWHGVFLGQQFRYKKFSIGFYYLIMYVALPGLSGAKMLRDVLSGSRPIDSDFQAASQLYAFYYPSWYGSLLGNAAPILLQCIIAAGLLWFSLRTSSARDRS